MSTVTILVGFALMLFLPCAVAFFGGRDPKPSDEAVLSPVLDPIFEPVINTRVGQFIEPSEEETALQPLVDIPRRRSKINEPSISDSQLTEPPIKATKRPSKPTEITQPNVTDPILPNRNQQKNHQARIQRSEMEALVATAAAARAQAEALAAKARLATAKAEAADADAIEAEAAAAAAIQEMRRAA
jgi:hypothetical protein